MSYPIKTLSQLPLLIRGFRKAKKLTQTDVAKLLGITQQAYAHFEAHPFSASMERLFITLRLLDVEISLDHVHTGAPLFAAQDRADYGAKATTKKQKTAVSANVKFKIPASVRKERW
jgi:HTH-type transcriptional regulator/antitoxin HipB